MLRTVLKPSGLLLSEGHIPRILRCGLHPKVVSETIGTSQFRSVSTSNLGRRGLFAVNSMSSESNEALKVLQVCILCAMWGYYCSWVNGDA